MVLVAVNIDGSGNQPVQLEPDIIYRIGRRSGLEFYSADNSMELAHATIALISGGIVRLAAVAGKIFVNGQETQITSISESDVSSGFVDLRFGNVKGKLRFEDTISEAHDSSGYDDNIKEKSSDVTPDSINIPETEPQSTNNTGQEDSFNIPETQAISFTRPFRPGEESKISLGEDFLIPETQEVLVHDNYPVMLKQADEQEEEEDDDDSELGTQIRICTQEFNELPADAIDDFDSSLLLDDGALALPAAEHTSAVAYDLEMSALNWSASNSKGTALNSIKTDAITPRGSICVTPDLSATSKDLLDGNCTPDLFDLLDGISSKNTGDCTPELLNEPTATEDDIATQQICIAKQAATVNIETPEPTQTDPENDDDFIETQAFPMRNTKPVESNENLQDFIETQAFPLRNSKASELRPVENNENIEDLIETQAFPLLNINVSGLKPVESNDNIEDLIETQAFPVRNSNASDFKPVDSNENLQDSIETEVFERSKHLEISSPPIRGNANITETKALPERNSFIVPPVKPQLNKSLDNTQDLVETQAFIRPSRTSVKKSNEASSSFVTTASIHHNNTEDMLETQLFVPPVKTNSKNPVIESEKDRLDITDSLNIGDEFDKELEELIALGATSNTPSDDEDHRFSPPDVDGRGLKKLTCGNEIINEKINDKERSTAKDITPSTSSGAKAVSNDCPRSTVTPRLLSYSYFSDLPNAEICTSSPVPDQKLEPLAKKNHKKPLHKTKCGKMSVESKEKQNMVEKVLDSSKSPPELLTINEYTSSPHPDKSKAAGETSLRKRKNAESEPNQPFPIKKTRVQQTSEPLQSTASTVSLGTRRKRSIGGLDAQLPTATKKNRASVDVESLSAKVEKPINFDFSQFKTVQLKVLIKDEKIGKQYNCSSKLQQDQMKEDTKTANSRKDTKVRNVRNTKTTLMDVDKPVEKVTRSRREAQNADMKTKEKDHILDKNTNEEEVTKPEGRRIRSKIKLSNVEIKTKEMEIEDTPISIRRPQRHATYIGSEEATSSSKASKSTASRKAATQKVEEQCESDESDSETVKVRQSRNNAKTTKEPAKDIEKDVITKTRKNHARSKKMLSENQSKDIDDNSSKSLEQANEVNPTTSHQTRNLSKKLQKATVNTVEDTPPTSSRIRAKTTLRSKGTSEDQAKDINGQGNKPSAQSHDAKTITSQISRVIGTRQKLQASEDEPNDSSKNKLSIQDQLKDINNYIKNIKKSSRKIQLSLSMVDIIEIHSVFTALKNVVTVAEDPLQCDVLIMDRGERTYKFLLAVAGNKPILSTLWLHSMKKSRSSVVRAEHIFQDEKFEQLFKFKPLSVLEYPDLLNGFHFMLGNEIQPTAVNMKAIIESSGGTVHSEVPLIAKNTRLYVVVSNGNKQKWPLLKNFTNVQYIKTEGVMQALVQHKTELLDEHRLKL